MKRVKRYLGFILFTALLSGCVMQPKYPTSIQDIDATIKQNSAENKVITANNAHTAIPASVKDALLPPLGIPGKTTPAVDQRFNVSAKEAPAQAFFMGLVKGTAYNMVVSPDVKGTITMNLKNVTVDEALEAVADAYGYDYQRTTYGYQISPPQMQTRIFAVNYLDVKRSGESRTELNSTEITQSGSTTSGSSSNTTTNNSPNQGGTSNNQSTGSGSHVTTKTEIDFWKTLDTTLATIVGKEDGRTVTVNPASGIVVVHAYPAELREIARYLGRIQNNMERQVILEAKILEVELKNEYSAGVNWAMLGSTINGDNGNGASQSSINLLDSGTGFVTTMNLSAHHGDFQGVVELLQAQGNVQVLSSPRVSTVNNQKAVIKVGDDRFYVTGITNSQTTGTNGEIVNSPSISLTPFFAGITLDVTPQINDTNDVILHIHPAVSSVVQDNRQINLGSNGGEYDLPTAASTIRESDSIVHAKNGQIVIIGGLMQNNTSERTSGTPGASKIPFFGALFRNTAQTSKKSELVILLRPIVTNNGTWAKELDASGKRFKSLDRGFHAGGNPEIFGTMGESLN